MAQSTITIGADNIDASAIVQQIRERAAERFAKNEFDMETLARAERYNLSAIKDSEEFFDRYITCLRLVTQVDINDFEITEKRARFAKFFIKLKRTIWGLLKFYTFHLWSQQNQVNGMLHAAITIVAERDSEQIKKLEDRIAILEKKIDELSNK